MSKPCYGRSARSQAGLTLVEVVAGLALLATLLVAILVAYRAHAAQIRATRQRLRGIEAAERLLTEWSSAGQLPAVGEQGRVDGEADLIWRFVPSKSPPLKQLGAQIVRLEIARSTSKAPGDVLTSVELLVPGSAFVTEVK